MYPRENINFDPSCNNVFALIVEVAKPVQTLHEAMSEMHVCRNILLDQINSIKNLCDDKEKGHVSNNILFCLGYCENANKTSTLERTLNLE